MDEIKDLERRINDRDKNVRSKAAQCIGDLIKKGRITRDVLKEVNNHVHTTYSFSPYEPAAASFAAWKAGLGIVGSIDHDSIGAAQEMLDASSRIGIAATVGFELRCSFLDTPFSTRKINNPDSLGIAYLCIHGVPRTAFAKAEAFLQPIREARYKRNRLQTKALNSLISYSGIEPIDFEHEVVPLSRYEEGGSITERHILSALAGKILAIVHPGPPVVSFLETQLGIPVTGNVRNYLMYPDPIHYRYDLIGVLKSNYLERFFIQPTTEETVDVKEAVSFGLSIGAIPAYAYLGDIEESVTGDKKAERFEDAYLEELVAFLADIGFPAVTYMPPRNTKRQMARLQELCRSYGLMEISGVDINSSRQSFNCPALLDPSCEHLIDSAWALVAHEKLAAVTNQWALFDHDNPYSHLPLAQRVAMYAELGRKIDPFHPETVLDAAKELFS